MTKIEELRKVLDASSKIAFFGGAGVSTESGIPDFRSVDGLYRQKWKQSPEEMLSIMAFRYMPDLFWEFYREKILVAGAKPNPAHIVLANLEKEGKLLGVATQNIDLLHEMAGSKNVAHVHGSIETYRCTKCGRTANIGYVLSQKGTPRCECGGILKPNVTLYGEDLPEKDWNLAEKWISEADTLIVAGTSLSVYPAANLVDYFFGKNLILINRDFPVKRTESTLFIQDNVGLVFREAYPEYFSEAKQP